MLISVARRVYNPVMFEEYKVYGPYGSGRRIVVLVSPEHRTTMAYARYLMCLKEGRILGPDEQVDHIDDDPLNDAIENLQVLTPEANREKDFARRRTAMMVTMTCPVCGVEFTRLRRNTHLMESRGRSASYCSRSCAGKQQQGRKRGPYKRKQESD